MDPDGRGKTNHHHLNPARSPRMPTAHPKLPPPQKPTSAVAAEAATHVRRPARALDRLAGSAVLLQCTIQEIGAAGSTCGKPAVLGPRSGVVIGKPLRKRLQAQIATRSNGHREPRHSPASRAALLAGICRRAASSHADPWARTEITADDISVASGCAADHRFPPLKPASALQPNGSSPSSVPASLVGHHQVGALEFH